MRRQFRFGVLIAVVLGIWALAAGFRITGLPPGRPTLDLLAADHGGQVRIEDGYIVGAPEWIGEVTASSASYDLHAKLDAYRRNGVKEYVVWRVLERAIDWFVLEGEDFVPLPSENGVYRSRVFPGLWLDAPALIDGQLLKVIQLVQQGVAGDEHQRFVEKLKQQSSST